MIERVLVSGSRETIPNVRRCATRSSCPATSRFPARWEVDVHKRERPDRRTVPYVLVTAVVSGPVPKIVGSLLAIFIDLHRLIKRDRVHSPVVELGGAGGDMGAAI